MCQDTIPTELVSSIDWIAMFAVLSWSMLFWFKIYFCHNLCTLVFWSKNFHKKLFRRTRFTNLMIAHFATIVDQVGEIFWTKCIHTYVDMFIYFIHAIWLNIWYIRYIYISNTCRWYVQYTIWFDAWQPTGGTESIQCLKNKVLKRSTMARRGHTGCHYNDDDDSLFHNSLHVPLCI